MDANQAADQGDPWRGLPPWPGERRETEVWAGATAPRVPDGSGESGPHEWDDDQPLEASSQWAGDAAGMDEPGAMADAVGEVAAMDVAGATNPVAEASLAAADGGGSPEDDAQAVFRAQLAEAMRAVARAQHARIVGEVDQSEAESVGAVRNRAAAAADELRASADQAAAEVEAWAAAEIGRVQQERERRLDTVHGDVGRRLEWHESVVEREIRAIEEGIRAYRADVESFFARLDAEHDPRAIAELATHIPTLPRLDQLGAMAPAPAQGYGPHAPNVPTWDPPVADAVAPATVEPVDGGDWAESSAIEAAAVSPELNISEDSHSLPEERPEEAAAWSRDPGEPEGEASQQAGESCVEQQVDAVEPVAPPARPADLIRERLRFIAERRMAMTDSSDSDRTTEPAAAAGS